MKFLAILVVIFAYRHWRGGNPLRRVLPFEAWHHWLLARRWPGWFRFTCGVVLPTLLVLGISLELTGWLQGLAWLSLSLLVLLYSIEIYDAEGEFNEQLVWLRAVTPEDSMGDIAERQEDFERTHIYDMFQSIVPALFWYLLAGPAGALFHALTLCYLEALEDDDPETPMVESLLFWLDWVPARFTGFLFALVGNFGPSMDYWLRAVFDTREANSVHLAKLATIAVDPPDRPVTDDVVGFAQFAQHHVVELRQLCERALFGWLGFAAIVVIIGW